jgi:hypothetical protein
MCHQNPDNPLCPSHSKEQTHAREAWDHLLHLLAKDVAKRLRAESESRKADLPADAQEDDRPQE